MAAAAGAVVQAVFILCSVTLQYTEALYLSRTVPSEALGVLASVTTTVSHQTSTVQCAVQCVGHNRCLGVRYLSHGAHCQMLNGYNNGTEDLHTYYWRKGEAKCSIAFRQGDKYPDNTNKHLFSYSLLR